MNEAEVNDEGEDEKEEGNTGGGEKGSADANKGNSADKEEGDEVEVWEKEDDNEDKEEFICEKGVEGGGTQAVPFSLHIQDARIQKQ